MPAIKRGISLLVLGGVPWFGIAADRYEVPPDVVRCESHDQERVHCTMLTTHGVQLVRQLSANSCEHGSQWDVDPEGVWVEQGCQAEFAPLPDPVLPQRRILRCASDGSVVSCPVMLRGVPVRLLRQLSLFPCKKNVTWGRKHHEIWVSSGCKGEFELGAEDGSGFVDMPWRLICESKKRQRMSCGTSVQHEVSVFLQLSTTPCEKDRNWGWDADRIWVDGGCRAEFLVY
ncbi:DUF3011 domain-containing protein [Xylella fastidiosa]|uniref:DUF3011 domain-containing protein n=1 Tax=Xylella fastidiosa TaxID=2371 RepID=UPI001122BABB|nr:DUF3011 domain-containing protein [Xylella fastidiosa]MDD0942304.1 DUF3011 domain-containing protein [Xylella fastidiosa subsp. multiplex]QTX29818.1 DUF3011 domain-containing protein [Xylella fastidiosa subsp. multiplex]TNV97146.1 hypothetical protein C5H22_02095 [Xylella fastidiosa]